MRVKILLLFFVFSFLFKTDHSFDQDLGRHLKLGGIIWQTRQIPQTNLFSYTNPDFPFINTHWLFEVFAYLISQTLGLQFLLVIKIAVFLISVWLILKIIPKEKSILLVPVGFIFFHVLRERTELRPEIFSFFFTATTFYILEKYLKRWTKFIFLLPFIQLVWINTHIYFFIGLILQAIFLLYSAFQNLCFHPKGGNTKLLTLVFVLSVIVSLINPNGLVGFLYPLNVTKNYGYTIVENQTMNLLESINFRDPNFLFVKISLGLIGLSLLIAFIQRRFEIKNILLAGFGAALALINVRSFPYMVFISLPAVLENFGIIKSNSWTKILALLTIPILLYESFLYLNGDYYKYTASDARPGLEFKESGKKALDFVLANQLPQPVYNNFDIGSYIIYRGYPAYKVFVDGRPEGYPKEFFQDIYMPTQSDLQKFKELDQKIQFKTIIFSHTDQTPWGKTFLTSIVKKPDWKTVYIDDFMIILVKNSRELEAIDLADLDPAKYHFDSYLDYLRLSLFIAQTGNAQSAQKFAAKALPMFPQSPLANTLFGIKEPNPFFW